MLDLSSNFAGPLAAQLLGDLGADVIKIERPGVGDDTRTLPPHWRSESTVFRSVNRNKRSVALDLRDPLARDGVLRLGRRADIVVESFRPGTAERLGLGYEQFRQANPSIIYSAISAFGAGPLGRERPGYDALVQAFSGMMALTGHPDRPPARVPLAVVDLTTGLWAAIAILAALARRERSGTGERVETALVDTGFQLLAHQVLALLATGEAPVRTGSVGPSAAPYEAFEVADGWLMIAVVSDGLFTRLCHVLDLEQLGEDPRFVTVAGRVENREDLHELLGSRLRLASVREWLDRLGAAGVPASAINELPQAIDDPVTRERGVLVPPDGPHQDEELPLVRLPIDPLLETPRRRPPRLGEHTVEVLREWGFNDDEVTALVGPGSSLKAAEV